MLELPEAMTLAKQLEETCLGKTVEKVVAGRSPHRFAFFTKMHRKTTRNF